MKRPVAQALESSSSGGAVDRPLVWGKRGEGGAEAGHDQRGRESVVNGNGFPACEVDLEGAPLRLREGATLGRQHSLRHA